VTTAADDTSCLHVACCTKQKELEDAKEDIRTAEVLQEEKASNAFDARKTAKAARRKVEQFFAASEKAQQVLGEATANTHSAVREAAFSERDIDESTISAHYWDEELKVRIAEWKAAEEWWTAEQERCKHKEQAIAVVELEAKFRKAILIADWVEHPAQWRAERHQPEKDLRKKEADELEASTAEAKSCAEFFSQNAVQKELEARQIEEEAIKMRDVMKGTRTRSLSQIEDAKNSFEAKVEKVYQEALKAGRARYLAIEKNVPGGDKAVETTAQRLSKEVRLPQTEVGMKDAKAKLKSGNNGHETVNATAEARGKDASVEHLKPAEDPDVQLSTDTTGFPDQQSPENATAQVLRAEREQQMMEKLLKDKERRQTKIDTKSDLTPFERMQAWETQPGWSASYQLLIQAVDLKAAGDDGRATDLESSLAMEGYGMEMLVWWEVWSALPLHEDKVRIADLKESYIAAVKPESTSLMRMGWETDKIRDGVEGLDAPGDTTVDFPNFWALVSILGKSR